MAAIDDINRDPVVHAWTYKRKRSKEVAAWESHRNKRHAKADWQFTTENARVKLKRLYPHFE